MRMYHGSPELFDRFDLSRAGAGTGRCAEACSEEETGARHEYCAWRYGEWREIMNHHA